MMERKTNQRKTLAPLFVYDILRFKSSIYHRMTQGEIIEQLEGYPFEITLERKALGRILTMLSGEDNGIMYDPKLGAWYQKDKDFYHAA